MGLIPGRWFVTPHALRRYREIYPDLSDSAALAALIALSERAHFVKRLASGAEAWRGPKPDRLRCVVAPAQPAAGRTLPQLVTVIRDPLLRRRAS